MKTETTTIPSIARTCLLAIVPALALASAAEAQAPRDAQTPTQGGLARARALFDKVDLDGDGLISAREAGRHGIPTRDFVAHDTNRDRQLARQEFVIFYRQLRVKAGKGVSPDLEAEAARIQAERRARQAADARRRQAARGTPQSVRPKPSGGSDPITTPPTTGDQAARIAAARKQAQDERIRKARQQAEDERIRKARQQAEDERIRRAREQGPETDADRVQAARRQADAERIRRAREQQRRTAAERIATARRQGQAAPVTTPRKVGLRENPPSSGRPPGSGTGDTPSRMDEQRARAYVKRLVDRGRLTPAQARDFYDLLLAPNSPTADQAESARLRAALKRVRQRIGDMVRKGDLSAEEGRQLSTLFAARAKAALPNNFGAGQRRVDGKQRSSPQARRVPAGKRDGVKQNGVKRDSGKQNGGKRDGGKQDGVKRDGEQ